MSLEQAFQDLPGTADEPVVKSIFASAFLKSLGFETEEVVPEFKVGKLAVDYAMRKNTGADIFLHSKKDPFLYMEVKGRSINLSDESQSDYRKTVLQLKRYLLAPSSKSVKWGLIMNSLHVQLFRKHGKIVHPVTSCLSLEGDLNRIVRNLKQHIESPHKALTIALYNNKGGVGKTTTTINLAATLTLYKKKVLVIDFDHNQSDLGDALNLSPLKNKVFGILKEKNSDIRDIITPYKLEHPSLKEPLGFDVIAADEAFSSEELDETKLRQVIRLHDLHKALEPLKSNYDYILIDSPPNWRLFAQKAIYASDVVLIPARHDNLHSLQNASTAITQFIPQMRKERRKHEESGPIVLPIFMNNALRETGYQISLMHNAIAKIIRKSKKEENFDLTHYFYPKYCKGQKNLDMVSIPYMAYIPRADFMHMPAAFAFKPAREQYKNLVMEYFL